LKNNKDTAFLKCGGKSTQAPKFQLRLKIFFSLFAPIFTKVARFFVVEIERKMTIEPTHSSS